MLQAAQISEESRQTFYHMPDIGRKSTLMFEKMLDEILEKPGPVLATAPVIRLVLDDSPTKRYGRKIEGADYHHNSAPGRTDAKTCFGHRWGVAVLVVTITRLRRDAALYDVPLKPKKRGKGRSRVYAPESM